MISEDAFLNDVRPASFPFAAVARSVADAMPSLRYCFLTTAGWVAGMHTVAERWRASRAWRVASESCHGTRNAEAAAQAQAAGGGTRGRQLVELHDDVADTIIAKENLVPSAEEQVSDHGRTARFPLTATSGSLRKRCVGCDGIRGRQCGIGKTSDGHVG